MQQHLKHRKGATSEIKKDITDWPTLSWLSLKIEKGLWHVLGYCDDQLYYRQNCQVVEPAELITDGGGDGWNYCCQNGQNRDHPSKITNFLITSLVDQYLKASYQWCNKSVNWEEKLGIKLIFQNFSSWRTYIIYLHWIHTVVVLLFILGKYSIRKVKRPVENCVTSKANNIQQNVVEV